ncbi:MAG: IS110 family transposase [Gemmatimonadaceae bacterium]
MNPQAKRQRAMQAGGFVAVDAGKFEHTLIVRTRQGADSKPFPFKTTRPAFDGAAAFIAKQLRKVPPSDILVGIEFAGSYGFTLAHYLQELGFPVVSVLPAHTKRQKEITHNQALKTDAKDAIAIADLLVQGKFVSFPFLNTVYADLRYLVSAREHVAVLKNAAVTRLLAVLDIVFPEYGAIFPRIDQPTALAILKHYPGPAAILAARKSSVVALLQRESRGHLGETRYQQLCEAAKTTLALPGAQGVLADEVGLIIARLALFSAQLAELKARMIVGMGQTPEAEFLLTIPGVQPVTAATFLGSIGDPQAYESAKQVLKVAGLSLVERSSGIHKGKERISKRGRPTLRRHAFMFALRGVREGGMYHAEFLKLLANNGGNKMPAIVAISRKGLKLMFRIAKERRAYVPMEEMAARRGMTSSVTPVAPPTKEVTT